MLSQLSLKLLKHLAQNLNGLLVQRHIQINFDISTLLKIHATYNKERSLMIITSMKKKHTIYIFIRGI